MQNSTVHATDQEIESEIFDPTGQGVEVVDAEFVRRVAKERDEAKGAVLKLGKELEGRNKTLQENLEYFQKSKEDYEANLFAAQKINSGLAAENARLREIFPKILESLGHSEVCGNGAALTYLENIPVIVGEALREARRGGQLTRGGTDVLDEVFHRITEEVAAHLLHKNCTTLQAVELMMARLRELEAREQQRKIMDAWED